MKQGFIKVCAYTHRVHVADPQSNAQSLIQGIRQLSRQGVKIIVTPELGITGYTCDDLFLQNTLLDGAISALASILEATKQCDALAMVGLPLVVDGKTYNTAVIFTKGRILGVVVKANLPNYTEFYEARHFAPAPKETRTITLLGQSVPFGGYQIFRAENVPDLQVGVEICEDLWVPHAPHATLAQGGATILCNLSASNQIAGKTEYRRLLVQSAASRQLAGYIYCDTSSYESTGDAIFSQHNIISESGYIMAETLPFSGHNTAITELDVQRLTYERRRVSSFATVTQGITYVSFSYDEVLETALTREVSALPFVPAADKLEARAKEILAMQSHALLRRIQHIHAKTMVVGVSGGLDSSMALLVCVEVCRLAGLDPVQSIIPITMPCFGTSERTKDNAIALCKALGLRARKIPIGQTVKRHLKDIKHAGALDVTYENAQARARTMVLMDVANQTGGIVVGTGDLSELALGFCTYGGDHMSMYSVNCDVPKSLMKRMLPYYTTKTKAQAVIADIIDTPISPELLPPKDGEIIQQSEKTVGSYDINDFILYYMLRWGFSADKINRLLGIAYPALTARERKEALHRFARRFFSQQFKRSCSPDGIKVGSVCLSPRSDWRMPSDASVNTWLQSIEALESDE